MSLKKVRGGVTGFGDTLISKTCLFYFRVSHKGRRGGGGRYIWYLVFYGNTFVEMYGQFKIQNVKKHCIEDISDVKNI